MSEEPVPFIAYWDAVDAAMRAQFGIDTIDAALEADTIAAAQEEGQTPEDFVLWFGEKYGLTPLSEAAAVWGRG
jgi:hypothetical protein